MPGRAPAGFAAGLAPGFAAGVAGLPAGLRWSFLRSRAISVKIIAHMVLSEPDRKEKQHPTYPPSLLNFIKLL
jgi:hypothetical protein